MAAVLHEDDRRWIKETIIPEALIHALCARKLPGNSITHIEPHSDLGEYHQIYFLSMTAGPDIVLRVARPCFPPFKVENEVAILTYVARTTTVPVPRILFWSNDSKASDNDIRFEYMAMQRIIGNSLLREWRTLKPELFGRLLDQIIDQWIQLRSISFGTCVGGLRFGRKENGELDESVIKPAHVVEEAMWQLPDIERYWNTYSLLATFDTVNISGPYHSYVTFLQAHLTQYCKNISIHPTMEYARSYIPRIEALVQSLSNPSNDKPWAKKAKEVKCYLAHRDTHMGNMIFRDDKIVGLIDWEFSNLVPSWAADPTRFMTYEPVLDPPIDSSTIIEKRSMKEIWDETFHNVLQKRAPEAIQELEIPKDLVALEQIRTYLRCILEVVPRHNSERTKLARGGEWERKIDDGLKELGF